MNSSHPVVLDLPAPGAPTAPTAASTQGAPTAPTQTADARSLARVRAAFEPVPGYLNAATLGLPPRAVADATREAVTQWQQGHATATGYDDAVRAARGLYAGLVGVPVDWVAVGSQTSVFAGLVAASLPDDAEVLCVSDDFSSIVFPFLVQAERGVTVRQVPLQDLAASVTRRTTMVAFSLAQSACGSLVDAQEVVRAAREVGALTFCDLTQAAGWLPVRATDFDLTVCSAYKWLCQPRGTAYLTVRPELVGRIRPIHAGWYAGADIWASCYGPQMHLATDASRFDVSPAWLSWVGAVPALHVLSSVPTALIRDHDVALADRLRALLGQPPAGRPVVSLADPDGRIAVRLGERGAVVASRAGRVRIAFHIWNGDDDVELVAGALAGMPLQH
jgi:selenocysteine lyase/cysteine desulfurase